MCQPLKVLNHVTSWSKISDLSITHTTLITIIPLPLLKKSFFAFSQIASRHIFNDFHPYPLCAGRRRDAYQTVANLPYDHKWSKGRSGILKTLPLSILSKSRRLWHVSKICEFQKSEKKSSILRYRLRTFRIEHQGNKKQSIIDKKNWFDKFTNLEHQ